MTRSSVMLVIVRRLNCTLELSKYYGFRLKIKEIKKNQRKKWNISDNFDYHDNTVVYERSPYDID